MGYKNPEMKRKYAREWVAKRRAEWFKENGPCVGCGSWVDLELDHVNHKNKRTHNIWSFAKQNRDDELSKCQVLCSNCHKSKTSMEGSKAKGSKHGSSKLTEDQVEIILSLLGKEYSPTEISKLYSVSDKTIRNIRDGVGWKHVRGW